jgi:hypothetical protein
MSTKLIKFLKMAAIILGLFVAFILVAAFAMDTEYSVERSIIIDRPAPVVFEHIRYLRNQNDFSVWGTMDPNMQQEYRGTDGTVGAVSAWKGNEDVGKGEQEIVRIEDNKRIDFGLRFIEPFEGIADAYFITDSMSENETRVTWGFESTMPRPMNLMLLFINMEELIGSDLDSGLTKLKDTLESD